MPSAYKELILRLEAEYERLYDEIEERHGGVDYQGRLAAKRKELEAARKNVGKFDAIRAAIESTDPARVAQAILEVILDDDDIETVQDVAADFIEDELGRLDWINNWQVIRGREDPVAKIQHYLDTYQITGNAQQIADYIDRLVVENPGRWK